MKTLEKYVLSLFNGLIVLFLAIMLVLVFGNVVLRYVFNSGIVFSEEVSRFLFMWINLIGALVVLKDHGHLGMSSVVEKFGETGQRICRFLADALTLACCLLLAHGTWKQVIIGMDDHAPVTGIPMGIIQRSLLISSVGMALVLAQETDILRGSTSYGPHHDDLVLTVNGINLRTFGSQGQQRTGVLSLKLAELEFLRSETGEYPILLLDDVMSELDVKRRQQLLQFIRRERIQTLITATDAAYFPAEGMGRYYHVQSGQITT